MNLKDADPPRVSLPAASLRFMLFLPYAPDGGLVPHGPKAGFPERSSFPLERPKSVK
jgi:hypothetical protein